jgi:hypothetical protein
VLDYGIDWSAWLGDDTITASAWDVPAGLAVVGSAEGLTDGKTTLVWLSGGQLGADYTITNRVTTAAGRVDERSIKVHVRDR